MIKIYYNLSFDIIGLNEIQTETLLIDYAKKYVEDFVTFDKLQTLTQPFKRPFYLRILNFVPSNIR